jgi:hypothetical protein
VYFQIWKLRLCQIKNSNKIGEKLGKKRGEWCSLLVMMFGGAVFRVQYAFPNMESEAVPSVYSEAVLQNRNKIGKKRRKKREW